MHYYDASKLSPAIAKLAWPQRKIGYEAKKLADEGWYESAINLARKSLSYAESKDLIQVLYGAAIAYHRAHGWDASADSFLKDAKKHGYRIDAAHRAAEEDRGGLELQPRELLISFWVNNDYSGHALVLQDDFLFLKSLEPGQPWKITWHKKMPGLGDFFLARPDFLVLLRGADAYSEDLFEKEVTPVFEKWDWEGWKRGQKAAEKKEHDSEKKRKKSEAKKLAKQEAERRAAEGKKKKRAQAAAEQLEKEKEARQAAERHRDYVVKHADAILRGPISDDTILDICNAYLILGPEKKGRMDQEIERFFILGSKKSITLLVELTLQVCCRSETWPFMFRLMELTSAFGKACLTADSVLLIARAVENEDEHSKKSADCAAILEKLVVRGRIEGFGTLSNRILSTKRELLKPHEQALWLMFTKSAVLSGLEHRRLQPCSTPQAEISADAGRRISKLPK